MNLFEKSAEGTLNPKLSWMNEPASWTFVGEALQIEVPESSDFFHDPAGVNVRSSAPFFYCEAEGDFSLASKVDVDMIDAYDSGCIMIMVDQENWAKLCFELVDHTPTIVSVVTKVVSDDCVSEKLGKTKPYLRVLRSGNCFGFHYSLDAVTWTLVRFFGMDAPKRLKIGVVGQCPVGKGTRVRFERFDLEMGTIHDARIID
jgi:regulation of enolase protein 1 (concanavalin A-like superfamily)